MYKHTILIFLFFYLSLIVDAQLMLNINQKSTNKTSYGISTVQKISFSENNLVVIKKDATTELFSLQNVSYLNFNMVTTDLKSSLVANEYTIYPNPVILSFMLKSERNVDSKFIDVQVVGIDGKIYINKKLFDTTESVFVGNLSRGVYFCIINNGDISKVIKFIKI